MPYGEWFCGSSPAPPARLHVACPTLAKEEQVSSAMVK